MRASRVWKVLGVAGLAGVAATGAVVARDQRRRVRARLHQRVADASSQETRQVD